MNFYPEGLNLSCGTGEDRLGLLAVKLEYPASFVLVALTTEIVESPTCLGETLNFYPEGSYPAVTEQEKTDSIRIISTRENVACMHVPK